MFPNNIYKVNKFRGGVKQTSHPFISGYFLCFFNLPKIITNSLDIKQTQTWLISACENISLPSISITYGEIPGFGGVKKNILLSTETSQSFTMSFREWTTGKVKEDKESQQSKVIPTDKLHLQNIFRIWASVIDRHIGLYTTDMSPEIYKGEVFIVETTPSLLMQPNFNTIDKESVLQIYHMYGMSPENLPLDNHNQDISNRDSQLFLVNFKCDGSIFFNNDIDALDYVIGELNTLLSE